MREKCEPHAGRARPWRRPLYNDAMDDRKGELWRAVEASVLRGDGRTTRELREAAARRGKLPPALAALVDKIHCHILVGPAIGVAMDRSEERRVGKECRSRWSA